MARPRNHVPTYRLHRQSGQAVVTLSDGGRRRDVLLGRYGSPESKLEYHRVITDLQRLPAAAVLAKPAAANLTVNEILLAYLRWAATHYRHPDGTPTGEVSNIKRAVAPVRELHGHTPAAEFGPRALAAVRQNMIGRGWCRSLVNHHADRIKRVFKWATAEELVPVAVYQSLRTLAGLRRGRTEAREAEPVRPADPAHVEACLPHFSRHLRAVVELLRCTGARPGEMCRLTVGEIDRRGEVWVYRPGRHKTAYHGRARAVHLGPKARAVLAAFLVNDHPPPAGWEGVDPETDRTGRLAMADAYQEAGRDRDAALLRDVARPVVLVAGCVVDPAAPVFSPAREREERNARVRLKRKSKVPPSQVRRKKAAPKRAPSAEYSTHALTHAARVAAGKAGVPVWSPNQIRHAFATEVRHGFGLEAAQVLLGHARADVTQVYAERDAALAARVAAEIG
ncbi:tyrosine-type recombinase/integrase [Gemmata sp.]|uniref:tyrosine-type recombinase/integrase n=1 Tax=Gemmata sp. TaxID=1914242 RepID=UPI003F71AC91